MSSDWIEQKTLPLVRTLVGHIDRRRWDVVVQPDRVAVTRRPSGVPHSFYLVHQLEEFCARLAAEPRHGGARGDGLPWRERWQPRRSAAADEMKNEIARLYETIGILRGKRRQAEAERDRWERLARTLETELLSLGGTTTRGRNHPAGSDKFRRAKTVVARLTHPDSTGATGIEARIREKLFKEFWAEFQRIEAER